MTTKTRPPITVLDGGAAAADDLVHYSPEEVQERRWLPFTARTLRDKANARAIPHSKAGGRISFTVRHIREIAAMYEVRPISERKRTA